MKVLGPVLTAAIVAARTLGPGSAIAGPITVRDYLIIATGDTTGDNNVGQVLNMQDSEIGAISHPTNGNPLRFNAVSPPGGNPAFPVGTVGPTTGIITLDGDAAVTSASGNAKLSNSDVHAKNTGPANPGSQGIDCANSFNGCSNNGGDISTGTLGPGGSASGFNQTAPPPPIFSQIANNNGYQGNIALTDLLTELTFQRNNAGGYWNLAQTGSLNTSGLNNATQTFTYGSGLHVIDINTGGSDFGLTNSNWIVEGNADTSVIFRINPQWKFNASQSNLLLKGGIGHNNVLFLLDSKAGDASFGFNNVEFFGYSFWDYGGGGLKNEAVWNNVRGCGQVVADKVNFNNVSLVGCSFDPTPIPEPGTLSLLALGASALGFGLRRRV